MTIFVCLIVKTTKKPSVMTQRPYKYRILVVDDEEDICDILQFNLQQAGYDVDTAASAEEALLKLKSEFHIILLDIMMDGISGLKMAQLLREEYNNPIPIIFLSALDTEADILAGFQKGGDDYIPKPFSVKEVLARVNAVLHRIYERSNHSLEQEESTDEADNRKEDRTNSAHETSGRLIFGKLMIDAADKRIYINKEEIILTKKECEILILLAQHCNKIFSREEILELVWKNESYVLERTVDVHIARLRKKLHEYGNFIINRSGYGYCFQPQE